MEKVLTLDSAAVEDEVVAKIEAQLNPRLEKEQECLSHCQVEAAVVVVAAVVEAEAAVEEIV